MNTTENLLLREDDYPHALSKVTIKESLTAQHPPTSGELMNTLAQQTAAIPKIGSVYNGGIYAGIIAGKDGAPDYHLIHATVNFEIDATNWKGAIEAAKTPINDFNDWSLPDRYEARLLAINSPDSFDTDCWYWTSTQHADYSDYAWMQHFDGGYQTNYHKSNEYRARAVRRVLIIQ